VHCFYLSVRPFFSGRNSTLCRYLFYEGLQKSITSQNSAGFLTLFSQFRVIVILFTAKSGKPQWFEDEDF